jgi:hypothetical protein
MTDTNTIIRQASKAKKTLMLEREHNNTLLDPIRALAFDLTKPDADRKPFIEVFKAFEHMAHFIVNRKAANISTSMRRHVQNLKEAHLVNKWDVLRTIPVVSAPVSASYLGVSSDALLTCENHCKAVFSMDYIGAACYSVEDLQMIAENAHWVLPHVIKAPTDAQGRLMPVPLHKVFVDWEVALAYTNSTMNELNKRVYKSTHPTRQYRVSDLEQIRIAKLNGQQH